MSYRIEDWAGNILFNGRTFDTFEDAWEFIYTAFPNEEDLGDYYVEKIEGAA